MSDNTLQAEGLGSFFKNLRKVSPKAGKKSFSNTLSVFTPFCDYKPANASHADSLVVYSSDKILYLSTRDKINLQCDCFGGSTLDGVRQPILYSFLLTKPAGNKLFSEPETINFKKVNRTVLITITFYLEIDNNGDVDFNGQTLTFTMQRIKS